MSELSERTNDILKRGIGPETKQLIRDQAAEIERLRAEVDKAYQRMDKAITASLELAADKEHLLALLRKAANEIDELGFPSKADEFLSAIITCANETERS